MNKWLKWSLWGVGGLAAVWVLSRMMGGRGAPETETETVSEPVPLLIPGGIGTTSPAGVSSFPDIVASTATLTGATPGQPSSPLLDLFREETAAEIAAEERARQRELEDRAHAERLAREERERGEASAAAAAAAAAAQAAQEAAQRAYDLITKRLRAFWKTTNAPAIAAGRATVRVCMKANGTIGVGKACAGAPRIFAG